MIEFREHADIEAPAEAVWPWIADPQRMNQWHVKIVSVARDRRGPLTTGERFGLTYRMSGRERVTEVEVVCCTAPRELLLRHHFQHDHRAHWVDEQFLLEEKQGVTRVNQSVDLSHGGMPWLLRPIVWFLSRFGRPRGEAVLTPLKRTVEGELER